MTDRIKSAREAVESWVNDTFGQPSHILLSDHAKTILEALSAYERLQGVDGMKKDTTNHQELLAKCDDLRVGYNDGYNQAIDDIKSQLVADINNELTTKGERNV